MKIAVLFLCLLFGTVLSDEQCGFTHLQYYTHYSLAKLGELNKTFDKIQTKVPYLTNITYVANDTATFNVVNIKPIFFYFDARQKVSISPGNSIIISGGRLDVRMPFEWSKTGSAGSINGTGEAFVISDEIVFEKNIIDVDGYVQYNLLTYENVSYSENKVILARISPPETTKEDIETITKMFNDIINHTTVRHVLEDDIDEFYEEVLNQTLHAQRQHQDTNFSYKWVDPIKSKGQLLINYTIPSQTFHIDHEALQIQFTARNKEDSKWYCNEGVHILPLKAKDYGSQEIVSIDIYNNTLRYAAEKGFLNTVLNQDNWQSRMFQFFAGDLYEVIPKTTQKCMANDKVIGNCKTRTSELNIEKASSTSLNVSMVLDCDISTEGHGRVTDFVLNLILEVQGKAKTTHLNFHVINFSFTAEYMNTPFKVENEELANLMIKHSLNRLKEEAVFGSGWSLWPKDYPHFMVADNFTVVYDSTHINPTSFMLNEE